MPASAQECEEPNKNSRCELCLNILPLRSSRLLPAWARKEKVTYHNSLARVSCLPSRPRGQWCGRGDFAARPAAGRLCSLLSWATSLRWSDGKRDGLWTSAYAPFVPLGEKHKAKTNDQETGEPCSLRRLRRPELRDLQGFSPWDAC